MNQRFTRRAFVVTSFHGVACALIGGDFVRLALDHLQNNEAPLLMFPKDVERTIHAYLEYESYELCLGPRVYTLPAITWRQYFEDYCDVDTSKYTPEQGEEFVLQPVSVEELDDPCPEEVYVDAWARVSSPNALGYRYLRDVGLAGTSLRSGWDPIGGIEFMDGPIPGNNYLGVHAQDKISLSLLQERLNQLGAKTRIVIADDNG